MDLEDDPPARRRPRQDSQDSLATPEREMDGQIRSVEASQEQ